MLSFPMKYVCSAIGVLPPLAPRIGSSTLLGPFDRCRQVSDDRVEPHVDPLVVAFLVTGDRNRNTPVEIARDRTGFELLHEVEREAADVLPPTVLAL